MLRIYKKTHFLKKIVSRRDNVINTSYYNLQKSLMNLFTLNISFLHKSHVDLLSNIIFYRLTNNSKSAHMIMCMCQYDYVAI